MKHLLEQLNDSQREAVVYNEGPSLVIAGAGSGKTRVLTYKIAWLLENGILPWNILALTFTNKAANEMKHRIGQLVGEDKARHINMGSTPSFRAFCECKPSALAIMQTLPSTMRPTRARW